jgi:hypothetical protein
MSLTEKSPVTVNVLLSRYSVTSSITSCEFQFCFAFTELCLIIALCGLGQPSEWYSRYELQSVTTLQLYDYVVRFQVITVSSIQTTVFWDVVPYSPVY